MFSALALPVLAARLRLQRALTTPSLLAGLTIALALIGPWVAYQRFIDPPGNRLTKMHLAGVAEIDERGLTRAVLEEYGKLGVSQYLAGRVTNIRAQIWGDERKADETLADWGRRQQFYHPAAALDFLLIGLAGSMPLFRRFAVETREQVATNLRSLALFAVATILISALLLFTPGSAVVHQGSFAAMALLFVCAAAGLPTLPMRFGIVALAAHGAVFAWLWLLTRQVSIGVSAKAWQPAYVVAAGMFACAFGALVSLTPAETPDPPRSSIGWIRSDGRVGSEGLRLAACIRRRRAQRGE